jgi:hypothetical protein
MTRSLRRTVPILIAALALGAAAPALAKHGDDDPAGDDRGGRTTTTQTTTTSDDRGGDRDRDRGERRVAGRCTGGATAKLKAKHDDGRLEAEFEVDQNRNGVTWRVVLRRNGDVAVSTRATTRAPSGSFSVERKLTDGPGTDRISARATSPSGQVCTASVSV